MNIHTVVSQEYVTLQRTSQDRAHEEVKLLRSIRHNENHHDVALANRAAFAGSLKTLKEVFAENPDEVFKEPAECYSPSSYRALFSPTSPQLLGTPLIFSVLSARQPVEKINFLKKSGQILDIKNPNPKRNPFWAAIERHTQENSTLSLSIIITLLKNYPEAMLSRNEQGATVLMYAARKTDPELVAQLLWTTNYNAQLIDAPITHPGDTPAEMLGETPDAARVITPANYIQTALQMARATSYTFRFQRFFQPLESFFCESLFKAKKQACIELLEDAEALVKKRARTYVETHKNASPIKALYEKKLKKEQ